MTEKFTASNGVDVETDVHGCVSVTGLNSLRDESQALREFFLHERDQELGRWRWPENPDYVVTPRTQKIKGQRVVRVSRESTGNVNDIREVEPIRRSDDSANAAHAYFAAHPEKKSWHDAKRGEVWVITLEGVERAALYLGEYCWQYGPEGSTVYSPGSRITEARRIWPESKES